jgi:hypothetical protein
MTLLDDSYEFPEDRSPRARNKVAPAIRLALENPGRAVLVTELGTIASASARASAIRRRLAAGVPGGHTGSFEVGRDGTKVVLRFVPDTEPTPTGEDLAL